MLKDIYTLEQVIDCVLNERLEDSLRANFARLLIHLHLDRDPLERIVVPVRTRVWSDIAQSKIEIMPKQTGEIDPVLLRLKPAMNAFILKLNGQLKVYEKDKNAFILESLNMIEMMIALGFYNSEAELKEVTTPLISLLNGSLDFIFPDEER